MHGAGARLQFIVALDGRADTHCNRINALLTQKIAGLKGARFNLHNGKVIERAELGGR
jgi:hypothetical protein